MDQNKEDQEKELHLELRDLFHVEAYLHNSLRLKAAIMVGEEDALQEMESIAFVSESEMTAFKADLIQRESELAEEKEQRDYLLKHITIKQDEALLKLHQLYPHRGQAPQNANSSFYDVSDLSRDEIALRTSFNNLAAVYNKSYLPGCVVQDDERGWVELRCPLCGRNGERDPPNKGSFFEGQSGFRLHFVQDHRGEDRSHFHESSFFVHRILDAAEVDRLRFLRYSEKYLECIGYSMSTSVEIHTYFFGDGESVLPGVQRSPTAPSPSTLAAESSGAPAGWGGRWTVAREIAAERPYKVDLNELLAEVVMGELDWSDLKSYWEDYGFSSLAEAEVYYRWALDLKERVPGRRRV